MVITLHVDLHSQRILSAVIGEFNLVLPALVTVGVSDLVDHHLLLDSDLHVFLCKGLSLVEQLAHYIRLSLAGD